MTFLDLESLGFQFLNMGLRPAPQGLGLALLVLQFLNSAPLGLMLLDAALAGLSVLSQAFLSLTLLGMELLDAKLLDLAFLCLCLLVPALLGVPSLDHAFQSLEMLDLGAGPTAMGWSVGVLAAFPETYLVRSC